MTHTGRRGKFEGKKIKIMRLLFMGKNQKMSQDTQEVGDA
jgi:hypothetical protein